MRYLTTLFPTFFVLILALGCGSDCIYQQSFSLPEAGWAYEDSIRFDFEIPDTSAHYNLNLKLKHAWDFPYQNLYVKFYTRFPSGKMIEQLVSLELTENAVVWQGECSGKWCTINIPLQSNAYFPETGKYSITLEQYMRQSPVEGVKSFSLCVKPTGSEN